MRLWYHPESDSYWIADDAWSEDGLIEDVTGIKRHVENAKARGIKMEDEKPMLRRDALPEMARHVADFLEPMLVDALKAATKCCPNCANFNKKDEICFLNKKRPPAKIIAFGCECFEEETIPF